MDNGGAEIDNGSKLVNRKTAGPARYVPVQAVRRQVLRSTTVPVRYRKYRTVVGVSSRYCNLRYITGSVILVQYRYLYRRLPVTGTGTVPGTVRPTSQPQPVSQ